MRGFRREQKNTGGETAVQLRDGGSQPFGALKSYVPLSGGDTALYRAIREAVPVVDAAICKLVRLTGGLSVQCSSRSAEAALGEFLRTVSVGRGQYGFNAFMDCYLDSLLTCGHVGSERDGMKNLVRIIGEIAPELETKYFEAGEVYSCLN